jgi:hypothetical protein
VAFYPPRPNPSFGSMVFRFDLPREAEVSLEVFDLSGRRVASVIEGTLGAGARELRWSARRDDGGPLEAGLYFARFRGAGLLANERLIVLP